MWGHLNLSLFIRWATWSSKATDLVQGHTPTEPETLVPNKFVFLKIPWFFFLPHALGTRSRHILAWCGLSLCPLPAGISSHSCPVVREHVSWGERKAQSYSFDNCAFQSRFVFWFVFCLSFLLGREGEVGERQPFLGALLISASAV